MTSKFFIRAFCMSVLILALISIHDSAVAGGREKVIRGLTFAPSAPTKAIRPKVSTSTVVKEFNRASSKSTSSSFHGAADVPVQVKGNVSFSRLPQGTQQATHRASINQNVNTSSITKNSSPAPAAPPRQSSGVGPATADAGKKPGLAADELKQLDVSMMSRKQKIEVGAAIRRAKENQGAEIGAARRAEADQAAKQKVLIQQKTYRLQQLARKKRLDLKRAQQTQLAAKKKLEDSVRVRSESHVRSANPDVIYGTPQGQLIKAPAGYRAVTAQDGKGLVLLPKGQVRGDNSNIIRYGQPNAANPGGYIRYYNSDRQPLNPLTGKPGSDPATHIPLDFKGPLLGYPGGKHE